MINELINLSKILGLIALIILIIVIIITIIQQFIDTLVNNKEKKKLKNAMLKSIYESFDKEKKEDSK